MFKEGIFPASTLLLTQTMSNGLFIFARMLSGL